MKLCIKVRVFKVRAFFSVIALFDTLCPIFMKISAIFTLIFGKFDP